MDKNGHEQNADIQELASFREGDASPVNSIALAFFGGACTAFGRNFTGFGVSVIGLVPAFGLLIQFNITESMFYNAQAPFVPGR